MQFLYLKSRKINLVTFEIQRRLAIRFTMMTSSMLSVQSSYSKSSSTLRNTCRGSDGVRFVWELRFRGWIGWMKQLNEVEVEKVTSERKNWETFTARFFLLLSCFFISRVSFFFVSLKFVRFGFESIFVSRTDSSSSGKRFKNVHT